MCAIQEEVWQGELEEIVNTSEDFQPFLDWEGVRQATGVGNLKISLGAGHWRLRCRAEGTSTGTSGEATVDYDVLPQTEPPQLFETGGMLTFCLCVCQYDIVAIFVFLL